MPSHHRDLQVWQSAVDLAENIYRATASFPPSEINSLTAQLRTSAIAIPSHIAQGCGRKNRREYRVFVAAAEGYNEALQTQLILATRLKYGDAAELSRAADLSVDVGRMLQNLQAQLQRPKKVAPGTHTHV